jgi:hypothetical protein
MTKAENLQELLSLLNEAQDLIEEIYGDADEAFDMSINLSNVISDVEVEIDIEDIKLDQNLTINGVPVIIESRQ